MLENKAPGHTEKGMYKYWMLTSYQLTNINLKLQKMMLDRLEIRKYKMFYSDISFSYSERNLISLWSLGHNYQI